MSKKSAKKVIVASTDLVVAGPLTTNSAFTCRVNVNKLHSDEAAKWQALSLAAYEAELLGAGKPAIVAKQTHVASGMYTGKIYNRPTKEGACLTVWEYLDYNNVTRQEAIAALDGIVNKITVGVQYGHWHRFYN